MSSSDVKDIRVSGQENAKRVMYLTKELLLNHDLVDVVSGTNGSIVAARAAENLVRLNYVSYVDIRTETNVVNDARKTKVVIRLKKTDQFKQLYDENEANRKRLQENDKISTPAN